MTKQELTDALEVLVFWAGCFDYANYSGNRPMYGGEAACRKAERLIEDFIEQKGNRNE